MTDKEDKRVISEAERREIREAFEILDEDGDGKLSLEDMKTLLLSQFVVYTGTQANDAVRGIDTNGNGAIEFAEFEKYVIDNKLYLPTSDEFSSEMKDAFDMFDRDQNGYIDQEEFKSFMAKFGDRISDEQVMDIMKEADTNRDGRIDYAEFCAYISKTF